MNELILYLAALIQIVEYLERTGKPVPAPLAIEVDRAMHEVLDKLEVEAQ